jgi:hypothetical protein
MVACSKAFSKTEIWEVHMILSLKTVFIQTAMKRDAVIFQETVAGSLQPSLNREPNIPSSLLGSPSW